MPVVIKHILKLALAVARLFLFHLAQTSYKYVSVLNVNSLYMLDIFKQNSVIIFHKVNNQH